MFSETVELKGHIIDSLTLPKVLDRILAGGGRFDIEKMTVGQGRTDPSYARIRVTAATSEALANILSDIRKHGAMPIEEQDALLVRAPKDGVFPEGFYATTNLETFVRLEGQWVEVQGTEMDSGIVVEAVGGKRKPRWRAKTVRFASLRKCDRVVVGHAGVRVVPVERERESEREIFQFMGSSISSEKPKGLLIREIAAEIKAAHAQRGKVLVVAGPAVVHTGAGEHLARIIEAGYVDVLFAGNALAVHDIEFAIFHTSLGVLLEKGDLAKFGHEHHLRAINKIRALGSIEKAVRRGVLTSGVMYACVTKRVPYVLAGSIRDDGPLPGVITDVMAAQDAMRKRLKGVRIALLIATTLHSIATGNLLPASVKTICVDINPAVVTKLTDRGSFQSLGLVTDTEPFLRELAANLLP